MYKNVLCFRFLVHPSPIFGRRQVSCAGTACDVAQGLEWDYTKLQTFVFRGGHLPPPPPPPPHQPPTPRFTLHPPSPLLEEMRGWDRVTGVVGDGIPKGCHLRPPRSQPSKNSLVCTPSHLTLLKLAPPFPLSTLLVSPQVLLLALARAARGRGG